LRRSTCWVWLYCLDRTNCHHHAAAALAPFIIRWGEDTSSDVLRQAARCTHCGRKGATLMLPSWQDSEVGMAPFPVSPVADMTSGRPKRTAAKKHLAQYGGNKPLLDDAQRTLGEDP